MDRFDTDVLVAGAGPVGLMLAAELLRHGATCRLVDRLPEASPFCRALGVQSRTLEILSQLGLAEQALERGVRILAANTWKDGALVRRMELDWDPLPDIPFPMFLSLEQNLLEELLAWHLGRLGGRVEREVALVDFTQDPDGVTATLSSPEGTRTVRCRYLAGCDGAHSLVRKKLGIPFEGEPYPDTYILADADVEGWLSPEESHRFIRGDEVLMAVPMRGTRRFRFSTRETAPAPPSTTEHGLLLGEGRPPAMEEIQQALDRIAGPGLRLLRGRWTSRYRVSRRLAAHYRVDRVLLAGDAAHIHPPTGGQGMNMGIQDAHNLGWKLALCLRGSGTPQLLDSYEPERRRVAVDVLGHTDRAFRSPGGVADVDEITGARQLVQQWAQLDMTYRGLDLLEQHEPAAERSPVQAGDRAPDGLLVELPANAGLRVFDLFRKAGYHLLLFSRGRLQPDTFAELAARVARDHGREVCSHFLLETGAPAPPGLSPIYTDPGEAVAAAYGVEDDTVVLVRPDGYVAFRSDSRHSERLLGYLDRVLGPARVAPR